MASTSGAPASAAAHAANAPPKRAVSRHKPAPRRVTFAPESEAEEPRPYLEFEAWSLDWQEFAPSVTGHKYALNFVEHKHELLYSIYVPDTGNKTTIAAFDESILAQSQIDTRMPERAIAEPAAMEQG